MRGVHFLVGAIVALAGSTVSAQSLVYRVDHNGTLGSQQAVSGGTVALGSFSGDLVLYIYDSATVNSSITTGTSSLDAPAITISGSPATGARLLVAFVDGDVPTSTSALSWAEIPDPVFNLGRGVRSLGGISFGSTTLRDRSMLIARIGTGSAGDVTGAIDVGRIRTLDVSGSITANLTSRLLDNTPESASDAGLGVPGFSIDRIRVGNKIDGDITAAADSATGFTGSTGSIGTIIVDGTDAAGITKDVLALKGSIGSIFTNGPIGTSATAKSKIWARNGIREIIAGGSVALT